MAYLKVVNGNLAGTADNKSLAITDIYLNQCSEAESDRFVGER